MTDYKNGEMYGAVQQQWLGQQMKLSFVRSFLYLTTTSGFEDATN